MVKYTVILGSQPEKYYRRVPFKIAKALENCFVYLEDNPRRRLSKIKRLKGHENLYRYRIGDLRVIYEVYEDKKEVAVVAILPRGDAYKKL